MADSGQNGGQTGPPAPGADLKRERAAKTLQGCLAVLCLAAMFPVCFLAGPAGKLGAWLVNLALATAFVAFAGKATTRDWRGALINGQNTLSLARLQTLCWTVVVVSAYITAATANALAGEDAAGPTGRQLADADAAVEEARADVARVTSQLQEAGGPAKQPELAKRLEGLKRAAKELRDARRPGSSVIAIPAAVWMLLGVSLTSLAGSPLILSYKKERAPDPDEKKKTFDALRQQSVNPDTLRHEGQVVAKTTPGEAAFADLFRGEETGNAATLDLGRVQLFLFTAGVLVAYAISLGARFRTALPVHEFPDLDASIATLLGVSNAGYLLNKAIPHSETEPPRPGA